MAAQTASLYTALSDDRSYRHQVMPTQLLQGLRPRLALGGGPGHDVTLGTGGKQVIHIVLLLTTLTSSDQLLSPAHELLRLSLFHLSTLNSLTIMMSDCLVS